MSVEARAEMILLARELRVGIDELSFLGSAPDEQLRRLRQRMARALDGHHARLFRAMAIASHRVPKGLAARIGMARVGPMICGRMATELAPEHAASFMEHVTPQFMAECCPYIRPEKLGPLASGLPLDVIRPVMRLLLERGEHVTIAQFAGEVPVELVVDTAGLMSPADLAMVMLAAPDPAVFLPALDGLEASTLDDVIAAADELGAPPTLVALVKEVRSNAV